MVRPRAPRRRHRNHVDPCWDVNYRSEDLTAPSDPRIRRRTTCPEGSFDLILALTFSSISTTPSPFSPTPCPVVGGHPRGERSRPSPAVLQRRPHARAPPPLPATRTARGARTPRRGAGVRHVVLVTPPATGDQRLAERLGRSSNSSGIGNWSAGPRTTRLITSGLGMDAKVGRRLGRHESCSLGCRSGPCAAGDRRERVGRHPRGAVLRRSAPIGRRRARASRRRGRRGADPRRRRIERRHPRPDADARGGVSDTITVISRPTNAGKGRRCVLACSSRSRARLVGYFDADLATPPAEIARLVEIAHARPDLHVVLGSPRLLGHRITAHPDATTSAAFFATASSLVLGLQVYDTQCGARSFAPPPRGRRWANRSAVDGRSMWSFSSASPDVTERSSPSPRRRCSKSPSTSGQTSAGRSSVLGRPPRRRRPRPPRRRTVAPSA